MLYLKMLLNDICDHFPQQSFTRTLIHGMQCSQTQWYSWNAMQPNTMASVSRSRGQ